MADTQATADHEEHGHEEHSHATLYWIIFGSLCVLTLISFVVGGSPIMKFPLIGWTVMMAVSICKAMLVMLFFMHLKWEANWKYVLTIPASLMSVFLVLMLIPDVMLRHRHYSEPRLLHAADVQSGTEDQLTGARPGDHDHDGDHEHDGEHEKEESADH